ncbi:MAG: hypothetical protein HZA50_08695 [Planctomycetes bacterium]|nr:hypothetical protein [Planctomycetota bacterium]
MKRHIPLAVLRLILAAGISITMPFVFDKWGPEPPYHADGQQIFALSIAMCLFGTEIAAGYLAFGSIMQFFLRRKPVKWTLIIDLAIFTILAFILAYAAVTAKYTT